MVHVIVKKNKIPPALCLAADETFSWIVYGEEYVAENGKSIMLKWKNENHFEYINTM